MSAVVLRKMPLREYIEYLYFERFGKDRPDVVLSIEENMHRKKRKKAQWREEKRRRQQAEIGSERQLELKFR